MYLAVSFLFLLIICAYWNFTLKRELNALTKERSDEQKEFSTINEYNQKQTEIKTTKKAKALDLFAKQAKISNNLVAKELEVSNVTAFRYLEELEKEGKIKQNGGFGKWVYYSKIS